MNYSRRDLTYLLPLLAAAGATAQQDASKKPLQSNWWAFDDLPQKKGGPNGANVTRAVLNGVVHQGCPFEMHITELPPGGAPHPPHHHVHDEMIIVKQGTMAVTINGKTVNVGPGGIAFAASGEEHGWKNVGEGTAQYYVIAIGQG